ncbi:PepSY domain-containing protein [Micromonospora humi]|uniref:Peptidase propeptide and YPEB domain-containing protein n=1 Tax=Micromonospora humi TaxID=745366 RepID=A0A1C5IT01_9ACTN|nr:PepSY domain-containing protein [Micromonospora humi]SCG61454.1 Peptidase propeptide and YPEB domain-containing protein [Micromonospora humi]
MRRTSLMLAAAGGVAVLAVTGAALGVVAADQSSGRSAPVAVTVEDNPARQGTADDGRVGSRSGADGPTRTGAEDDPAGSSNAVEDNPARQGRDDDGTGVAGEDDPARRGRDDGTATAPARGGTVSRQRAAEVALARAGGGRVTEVEAETEHGRPAWSVKVVHDGLRHEIKVDRETGAVLEAEPRRTGADDHGGRGDDGRDDRGGDDHGGDRHGDDD